MTTYTRVHVKLTDKQKAAKLAAYFRWLAAYAISQTEYDRLVSELDSK